MRQSIYWFEKNLPQSLPALESDIETDVVVLGGGIAGLTAAQWLREVAGVDVVLLESRFCGSGATGIGSGLINFDTELSAHQFLRRFGEANGRVLLDEGLRAMAHVRDTVQRFGIDCDLVESDALFVTDLAPLAPQLRREHEARLALGIESSFYPRAEVARVLGSGHMHGAVRFSGSFGMNGLRYAQGVRDGLGARGVRIYENTPAEIVDARHVRTPQGSVRARHVLVCVDHLAPELRVMAGDVYHQQNVVTVSEPLSSETLARLFPAGPLLVYDAHQMYRHLRYLPEGRLVLGGGSAHTAYDRARDDPSAVAEQVVSWARERFPALAEVRFTHYWSGLFSVSKDLLPIAGRTKADDGEELFVALGGGGLAWSALAGQIAARSAIDGSTPLDRFLRPDRAYTTVEPLLAPLPKPAQFALSHLYAKSVQTGTADDVERAQRRVKLTAGALAIGAAAGAALLWRRRSTRRRRDTHWTG